MAKDKFNKAAFGRRKSGFSARNSPVGVREALFAALRDNDLEKAETLLRKNTSPDSIDPSGNTALHIAVKTQNPAAVQLLLFYGADPNIKNKDHFTPLLEAVWGRKPEEFLSLLVNSGADPGMVALDKKNALHIAVKNNYTEIIPFLVKSGVDVNGKDEDGLTPLHYALLPLRAEAVKALIDCGADPSVADKRGETALMKAIDYADDATLRYLLAQPASVATLNSALTFDSRESALHLAVKKNKPDLVKLLLEAGSLVNQPDGYRQTPLYLAFDRCLPEMAGLLIERGADVKKCPSDTKYQRHLVHLAAKDERTSLFSLLVKHGGNLHALDEDNANALHFAIGPPSLKNLKALLNEGVNPDSTDKWGRRAIDLLNFRRDPDYLEAARILLESGADPGISRDPQAKVSPLHIAVRQENLALIELLLKAGADPDVQDKMDMATPLIDAARFDCRDSAKMLLDVGVNRNARDAELRTPLHIAAFTGNTDFVRLLLEAGADFECLDKLSQSPLVVALKRGYPKIAGLLFKQGAKLDGVDADGGNLFHAAAEDNDNAEFLAELRRTAPKLDINAADHSGDTPLMRAVKAGRERMATAFLLEGADTGLANKDGDTPLAVAIRKLHMDAAYEIIKLRPDEAGRPLPSGEMPIHLAAAHYSTRLADILFQAGADINMRDDKNKDTPLHIAIRKNQRPMVEFLLTKGADFNLSNAEGVTPLQLAEKIGAGDIAEILKTAEKLSRRGKPFKPVKPPPPNTGWGGYI